jgi:N utilization substance protein B
MPRHDSRELALKILFEHDLTKIDGTMLVDRVIGDRADEDHRFAAELVQGVLSHEPEIDRNIEKHAIEWRVQRMPTVDRNILRLATYELMGSEAVPISVIIDEALELASVYSTDQAKKFINGVLGQLAIELRPQGDPDRQESVVDHGHGPGD